MEASKLRRLANLVIDTVCIFLIFWLLLWVLPASLIQVEHYRLWVLGVSLVYYGAMELTFQRTVGKFVTRTLVTTHNDEIPSPTRLMLRTFCRLIPLELISLVFSSRCLAWHDAISGTKVVFINY